MNIADQIVDILEKNPNGLKASEIAKQIGCTRKDVNSYLYAQKDLYEQQDGYIWKIKSAKKKTPIAVRTLNDAESSYSISVEQRIGNSFVSTLTITPNSNGYYINSTNNQIICSDCNRFFSIHARACPTCGCPLHYIADTYYKSYGAEAMRNAQRQQEQRREEFEIQRRRAENKRRNEITWQCYVKHNPRHVSRSWFEKLCTVEADVFERAVERIKLLDKNSDAYPRITDKEWYELIISDDSEYDLQLREWEQDKLEEADREVIARKAEEATRKIKALQVERVCKKAGVPKHIISKLANGLYTAEEVQERINAAQYFAATYPQLMISEEQYILMSVDEMKKIIDSVLKDTSKC